MAARVQFPIRTTLGSGRVPCATSRDTRPLRRAKAGIQACIFSFLLEREDFAICAATLPRLRKRTTGNYPNLGFFLPSLDRPVTVLSPRTAIVRPRSGIQPLSFLILPRRESWDRNDGQGQCTVSGGDTIPGSESAWVCLGSFSFSFPLFLLSTFSSDLPGAVKASLSFL